MRIPVQIITLLLCIAGELLMLTETRNAFGPFVSPIIHFACSIGVGISVLMLRIPGLATITSPDPASGMEGQNLFRRYRYLFFAIPFIAALAFIPQGMFAAHTIDNNNPNKSGSDVIPALMFYAKRFLAGEFPYTPIQGADWHNGRYPYVLEQGLGFAIYFYNFPISLPAKIDKIRQLHLSMSLISVAVLCSIYWYQRKKIDYRVFAIASFKIYLAVFYAFIQVPYVYLHLVPLMIDIPLLYILFRSFYPNPNKFQQLK